MFDIQISNLALQISYASLPLEEQELLCAKTPYDITVHDVFKFAVSIIDANSAKNIPNRTAKQRSFNKADRVLMLAEPTEGIEILGIFPTTCTREGQYSLDFTEGVLVEKAPSEKGKLQAVGRIKEPIRRELYKIYASRNSTSGQWIFTRLFLNESQSFDLELLCAAPRSLPEDKRRIVCSVTVSEAGRNILTKANHRVRLPLPGNTSSLSL